ncbi:GNAT family N-acetyltransferase [Sporosalibacterium faouarense]|uniref:GNAT family N-acetyltransferase n=1 Tax=Sporosalibacterium faouarense TaxID=516123 RepID=UPI00192C6DDC|nr:GNAT family N-acetyltransferase [Sporosalibacterium faouarense]
MELFYCIHEKNFIFRKCIPRPIIKVRYRIYFKWEKVQLILNRGEIIKFKIGSLTEKCAKEICSWKYDGIYSVYNLPDWEIAKTGKIGISQYKKREKEFVGVFNEHNEICGFFRMKFDKDVIVGLGLKPSLCGKGLGYDFMKLVIKESKKRYGDSNIRLVVRDFNERAIKCYRNCGFKVIGRTVKETLSGESSFYEMEYKNRDKY